MLEANEMIALRKIVGKTKEENISQQVSQSFAIQSVNEWVEREQEDGTNI